MELELNKKEYKEFIENIDTYLISLEIKVKGIKEDNTFDFSYEGIEIVEKYFSTISEMTTEDIKEFWAFVGESLRFYVGGDYKLAPKSEDVAFTPIIINYGFKNKWKVRLSPEVWRDKFVKKKMNQSILEHIKSINEKYGKH